MRSNRIWLVLLRTQPRRRSGSDNGGHFRDVLMQRTVIKTRLASGVDMIGVIQVSEIVSE